MSDVDYIVSDDNAVSLGQVVDGPEIPLEEVEYRASAMYVRFADAHAVYTVDPKDVHDEWSQKIIDAVFKVVAAKQPVNPANIQEFGHIPEAQILKRINGWKPQWQLSMENYCKRIQAEGMRTRSMREMKNGYDTLAVTPWREVETAHAQRAQKIAQVQVGGVGGMEDDAGYIFEHITDKPLEEYAPLPLPWPWVNNSIKGGLYLGKKYCFAGPPGNRKTSALFCAMHYAVMVLGKRWCHFPFDGGQVDEQILKFFVVHWMYLTMKWNAENPRNQIPYVCEARTNIGVVKNYMYINTVDALKMLYGKDTGCVLPKGAMEMFTQARSDMKKLQAGGGPGLLVMVSPKSVGMDVYRVAQRLRNELYGRDGLDAWSLDHMGKPNNKFAEDQHRIPENTRILTGFTDMEGPPCILLSQLSAEGIKNIGQGKDVDPHLRYNQELFQDADGVFMFQYKGELPDELKLINIKNREGRGGPTIHYPLRVQPDVGYIWDDPEWSKGAAARMRQKAVNAAPSRKQYNEDAEDDD